MAVLCLLRFVQSLALKESILAWFPTQEGFQHVHPIYRAPSFQNHLPVLHPHLQTHTAKKTSKA